MPQYTRPEVYQGLSVPEVLLTGHHKNIEAWRREQSIRRTLERRPDLLKDAKLTIKEQKLLDSLRDGEEGLKELESVIDRYVEAVDRPEAAGRTKRRAMALTKKLLAAKECTLEDIKGFYRSAPCG